MPISFRFKFSLNSPGDFDMGKLDEGSANTRICNCVFELGYNWLFTSRIVIHTSRLPSSRDEHIVRYFLQKKI